MNATMPTKHNHIVIIYAQKDNLKLNLIRLNSVKMLVENLCWHCKFLMKCVVKRLFKEKEDISKIHDLSGYRLTTATLKVF